MKQTSASHASQTSLSSTTKREPYMMTFNENGPFSKQNPLFDIKNNSHILNSTQTFKGNDTLLGSELKQGETTLLPEVIEEEVQTPTKQRQSTSMNYFTNIQCNASNAKECSKSQKDIDLEANDEDLSVYEDDDGEDSSEQGEKVSGYKLIKQMEDSRHTSKNATTRNYIQPDTF